MYPSAIDPNKVGKYEATAMSGGGYFYDAVLEYRVWIDPPEGDDYYRAFATYKEAKEYSEKTPFADEPLALVYQEEHIGEPQPGEYVHIKQPRIAEWLVGWLEGNEDTKAQIPKFLNDQHG